MTEQLLRSWSANKHEVSALCNEWLNPWDRDGGGKPDLPEEWFQTLKVDDIESSELWEDLEDQVLSSRSKNTKDVMALLESSPNIPLMDTFEKQADAPDPTMRPLDSFLLHLGKHYTPDLRSIHRARLPSEKPTRRQYEDAPRAIVNRRRLMAVACARRRRKLTYTLFNALSSKAVGKEEIEDELISHLLPGQRRTLADKLLSGLNMNSRGKLDLLNSCASQMSKKSLEEFLNTHCKLERSWTRFWQTLKYSDSIRVFKLDKDATDTLYFTLFEERLSHFPRYTALSYTWGDPGDYGIINHRGGTISLRRNLFAFLKCLHERILKGEISRTTVFWVDALCIDQHSISEKNQQVQQIDQTFRRAEAVLVWLGNHSDSRLGCLRDAMATKPNSWNRLLSHMYWSRIWIVQEFMVATALVLLDESTSAKCSDLMKKRSGSLSYDPVKGSTFHMVTGSFISGRRTALDDVLKQRNQEGSDRDVTQEDDELDEFEASEDDTKRYLMDRILETRHEAEISDTKQDLIDIINRCRDQKCSDPRDKVYALLSLSTLSGVLKVDYQVTTGELFWRVMCTARRAMSLSLAYNTLGALNLTFCHLFPPQSFHLPGFNHLIHETAAETRITKESWAKLQGIAVYLGHGSVGIKVVIAFDVQTRAIAACSLSRSLKTTRYVLLNGTLQKGDYLLSLSYADIHVILRRQPDMNDTPCSMFDAVGFAADASDYPKLKGWFNTKNHQMKHLFPRKFGRWNRDELWVAVPFFLILLIFNARDVRQGECCIR